MALPQSLMAAPQWSDVPAASKTAVDISGLFIQQKQSNINPHINSRRVSVDYNSLKSTLAAATSVSAGQAQNKFSTAQIDLPMPYGGLQTFNVYPTVMMEAGLAAKYPQIKTYKVVAESDQTITGVLDSGSKGFHAYLHTAEGDIFIDPIPAMAQQEYYSYYKRDYASTTPKTFSCGVEQVSVDESPVTAFKTLARTSGNIITYRIAVAATGEYSQAVKNSPSDTDQQIKDAAMAEIVTAISRINQIYERDLAISLLLVADNDLIVHTDPASDPYSDPSTGLTLINENQTSINDILGPSGYDVGHVLTTYGGGLAGLGVACLDAFKARGESGLSTPTGDPFYIDIVAHEIGHQLGANHTFNGTTLSCGDNRNAATAFEPGSGSTIMAYLGICGSENVDPPSDPTFHAGSIAEIVSYTRSGGGNTCSGIIGVSQAAPTANAGSDYTIPGGTAFALTGQASDPESDAMTYQWDQMDAGVETDYIDYGTDKGTNALFRSFAPIASPERVFPQLKTLLNNTVDKAETLPVKNRTLNFRFTARDGNGGVAEDDMQVRVDANSGPFQVLQPNTSVILNSMQQQSIQWNSACSELSPVNCSNVDILYSTDDGASYNSLVAGSTPNDGVENVVFPNTDASNARLKIACVNNVFFDISDTSFQLSTSGGSILPADVIGGSFNCGVGTVGNDIEPNDTRVQAQSLIIPSAISGTVNDTLDPDDYFAFVAQFSSYTFTLSNYGIHNLDLVLLNSTGTTIKESSGETNPSEVINVNLDVGQSYNLVVRGFDTASQDVAYTLYAKESVVSSSGGGGGALSAYGLLLVIMTALFRFLQTGFNDHRIISLRITRR